MEYYSTQNGRGVALKTPKTVFTVLIALLVCCSPAKAISVQSDVLKRMVGWTIVEIGRAKVIKSALPTSADVFLQFENGKIYKFDQYSSSPLPFSFPQDVIVFNQHDSFSVLINGNYYKLD